MTKQQDLVVYFFRQPLQKLHFEGVWVWGLYHIIGSQFESGIPLEHVSTKSRSLVLLCSLLDGRR